MHFWVKISTLLISSVAMPLSHLPREYHYKKAMLLIASVIASNQLLLK